MQVLLTDTRQKAGKHEIKDEWWSSHGVATARTALQYGDYMVEGSNITVDTKRSIGEVAQNISRDHRRFAEECKRAAADGYRLIVLIETRENITDLATLRTWMNDHCRSCKTRAMVKCAPFDPRGKCARHKTRKPIQGPRLAKAMSTITERYGVKFMFCRPKDAARIICDLLGVDYADA